MLRQESIINSIVLMVSLTTEEYGLQSICGMAVQLRESLVL